MRDGVEQRPCLLYDEGMSEQEPPPAVTQFGDPIPATTRHGTLTRPAELFPDGSDLPIFSGTPIPVIERPYVPADHSLRQAVLPGMPGIDYDAVLARDKELRRRRPPITALPPADDIFTAPPPTIPPPACRSSPPSRKAET
jgi:hypothetical protein